MRTALLSVLTALAVGGLTSGAGAWTGPTPVDAGTATAVGDPFGGIHLVTSTGEYTRWQTYDSSGQLGAAHDLPMGASHDDTGPYQLGPVAWTASGRALVSYANRLTVRNADGSWGPNVLIVGYEGSMAARDNEALIWSPASDSVHQLTIAADGTLATGTTTSLTQPGDKSGACDGGLTLDAAGNAVLVYGDGLEVREAVRTPAGDWTVSTIAQEQADSFICPQGTGQQGRLAVAWGESESGGGTGTVKVASGSASGGIAVQTLTSRASQPGDTFFSIGYRAGAAPDGSLFADGAVTFCQNNETPEGAVVAATAGPGGNLGPGATVFTADDTHYLDARDIDAPAAFGGVGLVGVRFDDASQSHDNICNDNNAVYTIAGDVFGVGGPAQLYTRSPSGIYAFGSAATDGHNAVIAGTSSPSGGGDTSPVIWVQGTPGAGSGGGSGGGGDGGGGTPTPPDPGTTPVATTPAGTTPPATTTPAPKPIPPAPTSTSVRFTGTSQKSGELDVTVTVPAGSAETRVAVAALTAGFNKSRAAKTTKPVVIGSASKIVRKAGRVTLKLKFTKAGKRLLKAHKRLAITLRITTKAAGASAVTISRKLTLHAPKP